MTQVHVGLELSQTNDTAILFIPSLHLVPFANYICFAFIMCIGELWKAVECVVLGVKCMLTCMESEFCCGWLQCNCY